MPSICDREAKVSLSAIIVGREWQVALQVHPIVQYSADFNGLSVRSPVHEEVTSTTTMPLSVKRADAGNDFVAGLASRHIRTVCKFSDCLNERVPINASLCGSEILRRPSQDVCEIEFCCGAEFEPAISAPS